MILADGGADRHPKRRLFAILEQVGRADTASLAAIWERLSGFLEAHAAAEEEIFYPELLQVGIQAGRTCSVEGETLDAISPRVIAGQANPLEISPGLPGPPDARADHDLARLRDLLDTGHDIEDDNGDGWTLLRRAIHAETASSASAGDPLHADMTTFLLARGADPQAPSMPAEAEAELLGHWLAARDHPRLDQAGRDN